MVWDGSCSAPAALGLERGYGLWEGGGQGAVRGCRDGFQLCTEAEV